MFHDIPETIRSRMAELEAIDLKDRADGTPRLKRLRQVPPEVGRFMAILLASAPPGPCIEIGTSAGYSSLWLSLACRATNRRLTTFEILEDKVRLARSTFDATGVADVIELIHGDAIEHLTRFHEIAFCFLDCEKEIYGECYELVIPRLARGGLLIADNAINFETVLRPMLARAFSDARVDAVVVPIGQGELVCRKL